MKGLWSFFQILSPQFAKCTLCGLELARGNSNANSFYRHLQNEHKEEWSKTYVAKYSESAGGKNEKVKQEKQEKPEKNMIEATHEWTTVVGSNEKEVETKKFFKKATDGFVTVYNGGRGRPKTIKTSEAVDIIEKSQIEAKVPEKIEVNNPENIKAKIPKKKLQSEKGKENVSLNDKTKKVLGIYLRNR